YREGCEGFDEIRWRSPQRRRRANSREHAFQQRRPAGACVVLGVSPRSMLLLSQRVQPLIEARSSGIKEERCNGVPEFLDRTVRAGGMRQRLDAGREHTRDFIEELLRC